MVNIAAIASGSNGNCYYIGNDRQAILVDAGISCRQLVMRMQELSIDPATIRGIFITHEHTDHIRGIEVLSKTFNIPVYITQHTLAQANLSLQPELIRHFEIGSTIAFDGFSIQSFAKQHDAADPCSFLIEHQGKRVSVLTDIGAQCNNVVDALKQSHATFLEANYDLEMLQRGSYPPHLKSRIMGGAGHLSNNQSGALLASYAQKNLKHAVLSHLSGNNNCPKKAHETVNQVISMRPDLDMETVVASREKQTDLFKL
mgnify:CR=1 FL=1